MTKTKQAAFWLMMLVSLGILAFSFDILLNLVLLYQRIESLSQAVDA
jgi:hypothetical protein